ncbi:MAG: peptidase M16 [Rhodanobacter sp. 68-29]|nr:insulinase family protein [Rhodanobacter sp.]ODU73418.1 MAG: peptidase [Rhodanobacter sp. SCN 69-32]OJY57176.1 MAG: peptidase M16 [Rhodanobacter sp. 68-29]
MRLRPAALLATLVLAAAALAPPPAAAAETLRIPPIQYRERTLPNGLQVLSVEDHASPNVAVQVWYHVGSRDDPQGRSGFAHLFEHLMFKSTKHMHAEQMDRLTEDVGGANNASTGDDITNYFEVVPGNHLQTLLWAEAERLSSLNVDEANFKSERAVVEEEYRQSVLAQPYGKLFNAIDQYSYKVHPYKRPTIGSIPDLEAATLPDVIAFHQTFYRPDNATLIVAGDFDPKQLDAWVDRYFGWIPKPAAPIPQVDAKEPRRSRDERHTVASETAPLPAVALTWLIPPAADGKDLIPLQVAAALLSRGDSSRLYQSLVYEHQVAQQVGADADGRVGPGLFAVYAILASGHTTAEAEKLLNQEIVRLATQPIPDAELDKVKTQLLTGELKQRQTAQGVAFALGQATLTEGSPARANSDLDALQRVTAADVQRVLRDYVTGAHSVAIDYQPQAASGKQGGAK